MKTRSCRTKYCRLSTRLLPTLLAVLAVGGLLFEAQPASAQAPPPNCIQDVWKAHGNSQNLTCTANDVRIAEVTNINITAGGSCTGTPPNQVCTCTGGNVTFEADYRVVLTAQTRYDIGLYFGSDGDPNGDGALTGRCIANIITLGEEVSPSTLANLDNDACGDIDEAHNPQILRLTVTVPCVGSGDPPKLKLPNCTSWRQPGSNEVCNGIGTTPATNDAFPGSPSKCNCQPGFTVNIFVEHPTISVDKSASPTQLSEAGGSVTYTVHVTNDGSQASVTITGIVDDPDNNSSTNNSVTYTPITAAQTCPAGQQCAVCGTLTLAPLASTDCTFTHNVSGNAGDHITDKACVSGTDSNGGTVTPVCDTATVSIAGVGPTANVTKTVNSLQCAVVRYHVKVENTDQVESLDLTALSDDKFGSITTVHGSVLGTTCGVDNGIGTLTGAAGAGTLTKTIPVGGNYQCDFDAEFCASSHTDTVTATLTDNDKHCSGTTNACVADGDCATGQTCVLNQITPSGSVTVNVAITGHCSGNASQVCLIDAHCTSPQTCVIP
jgi:hypothetical protein